MPKLVTSTYVVFFSCKSYDDACSDRHEKNNDRRIANVTQLELIEVRKA